MLPNQIGRSVRRATLQPAVRSLTRPQMGVTNVGLGARRWNQQEARGGRSKLVGIPLTSLHAHVQAVPSHRVNEMLTTPLRSSDSAFEVRSHVLRLRYERRH
jgi:hypothetical protein